MDLYEQLSFWWLIFAIVSMLAMVTLCTYVLRRFCVHNPFKSYDQLRAEDEENIELAFSIEDPEDVRNATL